MTDGKVELVKAVANVLPVRDAYQDAVQPAARQVGTAGGEIAAAVTASLRPLRTLRIVWDSVFDRIDSWVAEKLSGARADEVVPPPPNVAGSVVTGLVFVQDEPDLRELFVRLLAASMLKTERSHAHPAFAEFIKQMTPLEARIVRVIAQGPSMLKLDIRVHEKTEPPSPAVNALPTPSPYTSALSEPSLSGLLVSGTRGIEAPKLVAKTSDPVPEQPLPRPSQMDAAALQKYMETTSDEPWTGEASFTELDLLPDFEKEPLLLPALENLARLQLVDITSELLCPTRPDGYVEIALCAKARAFMRKQEARGKVPGLVQGLVIPTSLGKEFFRVCVGNGRSNAG